MKTTQFTNSLHELAVTVADSDFLKGLVDSGTDLINILTELVDILELPGMIALLGGGYLGTKNKGRDKMQSLKHHCFKLPSVICVL